MHGQTHRGKDIILGRIGHAGKDWDSEKRDALSERKDGRILFESKCNPPRWLPVMARTPSSKFY